MAKDVLAKKPFAVIISGYGRVASEFCGSRDIENFVRGVSTITVNSDVDETNINWYGTKEDQLMHPAYADFLRKESTEAIRMKVAAMRTPEIYTGKALDVQNFMQTYTALTAPPLADETIYPDLYMETVGRRINHPEITSYDVCEIIWPKVLEQRAIEQERINLRESIV